MSDLKNQRIHAFMEKFMNLKRIMRRTAKRHQGPHFAIIILHMVGHGKPVMASQISQKMEITNAAASQLIDNLVKHGWVTRTQDDKDRRITWIELTPLGTEILHENFKQASFYLEGLLDYLGEEDASHLERIIDKTVEFSLLHLPNEEKKETL